MTGKLLNEYQVRQLLPFFRKPGTIIGIDIVYNSFEFVEPLQVSSDCPISHQMQLYRYLPNITSSSTPKSQTYMIDRSFVIAEKYVVDGKTYEIHHISLVMQDNCPTIVFMSDNDRSMAIIPVPNILCSDGMAE